MKKRLFKSILASSMVASSLLSVTPVLANDFEGKIQDAQQQAEENEQAADSLNQLINQLTNDMQSTQEALDNLNAQITRNENTLTATLDQLDQSSKEMEQLLEEIAILEKNIEERSEKLAEQARTVQVSGNPTNYVEFILNAESLTDVIARVDVVGNLVKSSNRMIEDQIRDQKAVEAKSEETERKIVQQNALVEELEVTSANLEVQKVSQTALIAQIEIEKSSATGERDNLIAKRNEALQQVSNMRSEQEAIRVATERAQQEREAEERRAEEARVETVQAEEPARTETREPEVEPASSGSESAGSSNDSNSGSTNRPETPAPTPPKQEEKPEPKPEVKPTPAPSGNVLSIASQYTHLNTYVWGGTSPVTGFDCSGFTQYVFRQAGKSIPRTSGSQYAQSTKVTNPQPGDLVFFSGNRNGVITHVGIYTGGGQFIGSQSSTGVAYASATSGYWGARLVGYGRY